ncbi:MULTISPECIES: M48 family metallopeptidase [Campylobacter]|uniref:M48 family metallopeptidase n=1 Tax=Campylobacter TaxID=194 RepID=UPI00147069E5|nr:MULTISPECIES: SprT family zinc-dependent metalloprotease [Campylobacter]MBN7288374.1 M48 family metallopeptidase [Campylobacter curvus]MDU6827421.1 SprT family zinc-dependent metalloprotease [Campylobacter sp.]
MFGFKFIQKPKPPKPVSKKVQVNFNGLAVALNFKKGVKSFRLKVAKSGEISLSLPFYATQKSGFEFLAKHAGWLATTHAKILANLPKEDEFRLLGKIYRIKIDANLKDVNLTKFEGEIHAPNFKALEIYKKAVAKQIFTEFIDKFTPIINRKINRLTIRKMQTRWGSCNHKKGYINLSLNLIEKAPELVEYVVLHEMTHLIFPHHQKSFYEFLAGIMPDHKVRELALNGK